MPQHSHNNTFLQDLKCLFKTLKLTHIQVKSHCIVRSVIQVELKNKKFFFVIGFLLLLFQDRDFLGSTGCPGIMSPGCRIKDRHHHTQLCKEFLKYF